MKAPLDKPPTPAEVPAEGKGWGSRAVSGETEDGLAAVVGTVVHHTDPPELSFSRKEMPTRILKDLLPKPT